MATILGVENSIKNWKPTLFPLKNHLGSGPFKKLPRATKYNISFEKKVFAHSSINLSMKKVSTFLALQSDLKKCIKKFFAKEKLLSEKTC